MTPNTLKAARYRAQAKKIRAIAAEIDKLRPRQLLEDMALDFERDADRLDPQAPPH